MAKRTIYNTTIGIELTRKMKIPAAKLDMRQNDIPEEAIQDLLKKYNDQKPSTDLLTEYEVTL